MNQETHSNVQDVVNETKGLIPTLFDFSFSSFITTKFIKFIYGILILGAAVAVLAFIAAGFQAGFLKGLLCLIISPIVALLYLVFARMWTEMIVVAFRIAEHLRSIDEKTPPRS